MTQTHTLTLIQNGQIHIHIYTRKILAHAQTYRNNHKIPLHLTHTVRHLHEHTHNYEHTHMVIAMKTHSHVQTSTFMHTDKFTNTPKYAHTWSHIH